MDVDECRLVGVTDDLATVQAVRELADYVEFRLGSAEDPRAQLSNYTPGVPLILSPRAATEGGDTLEPDDVASIAAAAPPGVVEIVEVPLADADERGETFERLRSREIQLLISSYSNEAAPSKEELRETISECGEHGDLIKVVILVEDERDALVLLECLNDASRGETDIAGYGSGAAGKHTRVVSAFYGSRLAYAPIRPDTGSGDISLKQLNDVLNTIADAQGISRGDELAESL
ncbi:3-dehydroquinate dehydratase [Halogeometricum pallidum JCM 14848]|uniref:3-dehydroquinate dehydratase n=1 Tax=Halogeometricum pallidum JCM 14848 TaxID=1227487 RepID=M0CV34_HALPD|nr:type I 3-dehydroquinate dehydratase [Halogeometricum pallidum]ELZ27070.1 3-dehydroquinate dehydratase [Halogeometricum pallidum JCM 14848]